MKQDIRKATAFAIGAFFALTIWLISPKWWIDFLNILPTWADVITWISPLILGALAWYFTNLDIHNWLDKMFFGERKRVDDFIREQLTTPCRETPCNRANRGILNDERDRLMDLFYTFIPADDTERERAFDYWTEYFITVNLSAFSICALIIALIYIAVIYFSNHLLKVTHVAFIVIAALALLCNLARLTRRRRLIHPAQAQTMEILSDNNKGDLKRKLPDYRVDCGDCPLRSYPVRNRDAS